MKPYPNDTDLVLTSREYMLPPTHLPHPWDADLPFEAKHTKIVFLSISPMPDNDSDTYEDDNNYVFSAQHGIHQTCNTERELKALLRGELDAKGKDAFKFSKKELSSGQSISIGGVPLEPLPTPFDINVTDPCYLLLILDHTTNWRFTPGNRGVTTKRYFGADNFGVTFVTHSQIVLDPDDRVRFTDPTKTIGAPEGCKILYFSVARRRPDCIPPQPGFSSKQGFNFHIEFYWKDSKGKVNLRLPTIFDPDVPNSGGSSFP